MPKLKDLPKIDWPREKMCKYGSSKLTDAELLAIILRTGNKKLSAVELAKKIIKKFGRENLARANFSDLEDISGLGMAKATEILACFELGRRFLNGKKTELILSPRDVWENLKDVRDNKKEHFVVFFLDARNQKIQREIISVGILNANLIHPREVFEPAICNAAAQIIISHNHPSGDTYPSKEDVAITKRLREAGELLGIEVIDHVVVSENSFFSFESEGLL